MSISKPSSAARLGFLVVLGLMAIVLIWPRLGVAQDKMTSKDGKTDLVEQIRVLQAKIATLEAALKQKHPGATDPSAKKGMGGMMGMDMMGGMVGKKKGMMDMMMGGMGDKKAAGGMMDMDMMERDMMEMMGMMGMGSMGQMKGMKGKMQMTAALPGFPGASHIYHIGATSFFLDHPEHIALTTKQQAALNRAKEKALLEKATAQRKIDDAEQELWELTGTDEPDAAKIEAKIRHIEKLRSDQRMAFIQSVGNAAKILTDEQRQVLMGYAQPKTDKLHVHPSK